MQTKFVTKYCADLQETLLSLCSVCSIHIYTASPLVEGVVRWCWVNFQCWGVLLIWSIVGQGPTALAVGTGGGCLDIFSLVYRFSFLSPSLWETARYRLKYCLKGLLSPTQPTTSCRICAGFTQHLLYYVNNLSSPRPKCTCIICHMKGTCDC